MKKSYHLLFIAILTALILAACGQGEGPIEPVENGSGIDSDHNEEFIEENETQEENELSDDVTEPAIDNEENAEGTTEETILPVKLYFADSELMNMYSVETTVEAKNDEVFIKTLEAWIEGPTNDHLVSLIPTNVKVQYVEEEAGIAHVSFSKEIMDANVGSGAEEMLLQQIALAMKQFGFNKTQVLVDGEIIETLYGHININKPIEAMDVNKIEKFNE